MAHRSLRFHQLPAGRLGVRGVRGVRGVFGGLLCLGVPGRLGVLEVVRFAMFHLLKKV